jgi:hypothetical protein
MLWLATFLAWLHGNAVAFNEKDSQEVLEKVAHIPEILEVDQREKSFASQDYTEVRLPYGGNPQFERHVADITMLDNKPYYQSYQQNIRTLQILHEDHRLDEQFLTPKNNYTNFHMPEATFSNLNDYWKNRRASHV